MATSVTEYTARFPLPYMLVRGRANTITLPIERGGSGITPTSGTVTVKDSSGAEFVSAAAITAADPSTYAILASVIPDTTSLDDSWTVRWLVTFSDGEVAEFQNIAYIIRRDLHPVITVADVLQKAPPFSATDAVPSTESVQTYMDEAWERIQRWLIKQGRRPELVLDSYALWDLHLAETLSDLYHQAVTSLNAGGATFDDWQYWRNKAKDLRGEISLIYDADEDDLVNDERRGMQGGIFLTAGPRTHFMHRHRRN